MANPINVGGTAGVLATPIWVRTDAQITRLVSVSIFNPAAAISWVNFYDMDTTPTVGTTVPTWQIGLNTLANRDILLTGDGLSFFKGLWIAAATTATGNTAPGTAVNVAISVSA